MQTVHVYTLTTTLLILAGMSSLHCILHTPSYGDLSPLTISDVSACTDLPYILLFSSVLIASVYILVNSYDMFYKQKAVLGLLILVPSRTKLLSMIHCVGVYSVVHGGLMLSIRLTKPMYTKLLCILSILFVYAIITNHPLQAILVESMLFVLCLRLFLLDPKLDEYTN